MTNKPSTDRIMIRAMRQEDLDQVRAIDQLSFSLPWPASAYQYELHQNPLSTLWVATLANVESSEQVVGMLVVWMILDEAHIANIAVHPDFRGRGISKLLMAKALEDAIHKKARQSTLEVRAHNIVAQNLYRRFGFEAVGNRPRYYQDNHEDALIMTVSNLGEAYLDWLQRGEWETDQSLAL